jgi:hypothetical protein
MTAPYNAPRPTHPNHTPMRYFSLLIVLGLLATACANPEAETTTDESVVSTSRPDAANPLPGNFTWPADWQTRFDRPSEDYVVSGDTTVANPDIYFTNMRPGWHLTSGPAGIYWHPASTAEGDFAVAANFFQFDPGERNEAYGLFFGGSDLAGPDQAYLYFLIRRSGEYLVKHRQGEETHDVVGWTATEAISAWPPANAEDGTVANELAVSVDDDHMSFLINGTLVHQMPIGPWETDGIVGFRVNHELNLHISSFDVVQASDMADGEAEADATGN